MREQDYGYGIKFIKKGGNDSGKEYSALIYQRSHKILQLQRAAGTNTNIALVTFGNIAGAGRVSGE